MKINNRKKRFFVQSLKQYLKRRADLKEFKEEEYKTDSDGKIVIDINCTDQPIFDVNSKKSLNSSIVDYIEKEVYFIPLDRSLRINFIGGLEEKDAITKAYTREYERKLVDKDDDVKRCVITSIVLMAIGLLALALGVFLSNKLSGVLGEILSVLASFTMWESIDYILLERNNAELEKFDAAQLLFADLSFDK